MDYQPFPHVEVASKIALALAVGLFVGLEREWAQKEVGVRTFSIVALFGTLVVLVDPHLVAAALVGVFLLILLMNLQSLVRDRSLEMTTSASLLVTMMLAVLIGVPRWAGKQHCRGDRVVDAVSRVARFGRGRDCVHHGDQRGDVRASSSRSSRLRQ